MNTNTAEYLEEFDLQLERLISLGYPKAAKLSDHEFVNNVSPLRDKVKEINPFEKNIEDGRLPFVIVINNNLVASDIAMSLIVREGKQGITKLFPLEPSDFLPIDGVKIPKKQAYLLVDIDRGKESLNIPPSEALKMIVEEKRLPLTIEEGIAIVTQYPNYLMKNNCFSLLASRHLGDKRVPAIWINSDKRPNLGWCWNGNPHTWLGSASCGSRLA